MRKNGIPVDPYGWNGSGTDPYETLNGVENENLWSGDGEGDSTPPALITDFNASDGEDGQSTLTWTNPGDSDLAEVLVRRKTNSYPVDHNDGHEINCNLSFDSGSTNTCVDSGLTNGQTYFYSVFTKDYSGNWNDVIKEQQNTSIGNPSNDNLPPVILVHGFQALDRGKIEYYPNRIWERATSIIAENTSFEEIEVKGTDSAHSFWRVEKSAGGYRDVYISNFNINTTSSTFSDIRLYGENLKKEIGQARIDSGVNKVDIVAHSMGGLVARAYIENDDFINNPYEAKYMNDVRKLIMLGTPNHGVPVATLTEWFGDFEDFSFKQMITESSFLNILNRGCSSCTEGQDKLNNKVDYTVIAGDLFELFGQITKTIRTFKEDHLIHIPWSHDDGLVSTKSAKLDGSEFHKFKVDHSALHEVPQVLDTVKDIIISESIHYEQTPDSYTYASPVNVEVVDQQGRVVNDQGANQIPGAVVSYDKANDVTLLYLPPELTYQQTINSYDEGSLTVTESVSSEDGEKSFNAFGDIELTSNTVASYDTGSTDQDKVMEIDYDGDGTIDEEKEPDIASEERKVNVPQGSNIKVDLSQKSVTLLFEEVIEGGETSVEITKTNTQSAVGNIKVISDYFSFNTKAKYEGKITVKLGYPARDLTSAQEQNLKLYKFSDNGKIENITTSNDPQAETVTGKTDSFSYFGLGYWSLSPNWNIISPPGVPVNPDPATSLGDDLEPLHLYYDYSPGEGYVTYPDDAPETQLSWKKGYWTMVNEETPADIEANVPSGEATIELNNQGWHMIGVPYSVDWSQVNFSDPTDFQTDGAGNVRIVAWAPEEELYHNLYSNQSHVLSPWSGYWVKVKSAPASLTITESNSISSSLNWRNPPPQSVDRGQLDYPPKPPSYSDSEEDSLNALAYPNPVSEKDQVTFTTSLAQVEEIKVTVLNAAGNTVYESEYKAGDKVTWDLTSSAGDHVPNGLYLYQLTVKDQTGTNISKVNKLLVLR